MSDGMNRVILLGNLGADPELRYTAAGVAVLSMRLATGESYLDKNREPQERTEWHTVVVWGQRAESLSRLLTKGAGVLVEGALRTSSYEKDGQKRYRTEVHAREIRFAGRRPTPVADEAAMSGGVSGGVSGGDEGEGAPKMPVRANGYGAGKKPADPLDELPY